MPRILALETTDRTGSVALWEKGSLIAKKELNPQQRSAQSLAPAIQQIVLSTGWKMEDIHVVACVVGPGSFTGLRVGVTTAKILAFALGAKIIGIETWDVLTYQAAEHVTRETLSVALDAHRQELFTADYRRDSEGKWRRITPGKIEPVEQWLQRVDEGFAVSGPILKRLSEQLHTGIQIVPTEAWTPQASTVAYLAAERYTTGNFEDLRTVSPMYMRRSAAEEKRKALEP